MNNSPEAIAREGRGYVGKRVEIPVYYDLWMQGARFGRVVAYRADTPGLPAYVTVRMDHAQVKRLVKVWRLDWSYMKLLEG